MKWTFLTVVFLHGIIHLLGFVKGFDLKEIKEFTVPTSKLMGVMWLCAFILFAIYIFSFVTNHKYAWFFGFFAVALSQILIVVFWKDAKFGTMPNLLVFIVSVFMFSSFNFQHLVESETLAILGNSNIESEKIVSEGDIENLPPPVQHWLRQSGVVGKPFINAGIVHQNAEMKLKPEQDKWMTATAVQYTTIDNPAFIWTVDVKMNRLLNFKGRDKFQDGKGEMLIKVNSLINVVNEQGEKLDEGTIQRYLGEMVWFPSLALSEYISWESINDSTAKATMNYKGTTGSGTFFFNSLGDVVKFSAFRFYGNHSEAKRHEWVMKIDDYKVFEGIKVPAKMSATWKLDEGDWTWLNLEVTEIRYNCRD